ncbi:MAG TPA: molybdopterin oxidoreductase family protein [Amycolatopsis sp.]|uniref:molybdopterin oxidoreductase family protein n=1 Tax=Amycolatopsis sp. TaxID=37632 RepID=UPI002B4716CF|nr:molybdopterin oxidoreductase family protein [Amycolatopsis sp.]HKS46415.1 molybdopterin oxidoreductase family protein [Amycolatopsis sp.]
MLGAVDTPRQTATHCPYCALQCGMLLSKRDGEWEVAGRPDFPVNRGGLCVKGATAVELLDHPERLTVPLIRDHRDAPLRPASWTTALDRIEAEIRRAQRHHGLDSVGCFGGGGLTNEKSYQLGKFARVALRSSAIDYNGRFCMSSAAVAGQRAFGVDRGLPFPLSDVAAADAILLVGSNPADTMPPAMQWFDAGRARGARHIVVDPRVTPTAAVAAQHLQPVPGTDLALANGLLHIAIRDGLIDHDYIAARTTGFDSVRRAVRAYWPERVERITGVREAAMTAAVRTLTTAGTAMVLTARGAEQHSNGTDTAQAFANLALALGLPGRAGSGYGTITGQGNGQGGREHGQKADQLPGYRKLSDPAARAHVAAVWGVPPDELPRPGLSAYEMLDGLGTDSGVRVLLVLASNIVVSAPDGNRVLDRLGKLDFLVVSDFFLSETAELADVVLPTTQWAEEDGTMTNLEGRVLLRAKAAEPPAGVRSDLEILWLLANRLGRGEFFDSGAREVYDELRRASAGGPADYAGITLDRLAAGEELFWPCPSEQHPSTPRLFTDRFPTPDGRARFVPVRYRPVTELPDPDFPWVLTTGRTMKHYQSGTQTRRSPTLAAAEPVAYAELHPELARLVGVSDGEDVQLTTRRGTAVLRARVTDTLRADTVFVPFHWRGVNALTAASLDPHSRMPEFKTCAVAVSKPPSNSP